LRAGDSGDHGIEDHLLDDRRPCLGGRCRVDRFRVDAEERRELGGRVVGNDEVLDDDRGVVAVAVRLHAVNPSGAGRDDLDRALAVREVDLGLDRDDRRTRLLDDPRRDPMLVGVAERVGPAVDEVENLEIYVDGGHALLLRGWSVPA
jgi:hypothetical protein